MDSKQTKVDFWIGWTVANAIGVSAGWALGEYVGQWHPGLAGLVFAIPIWLMRWAVLHRRREFNVWKPLELIIWLSGEMVGYVIGVGFKENGSTWTTAGPIFGLFSGAGVWFMLRAIRQAKTQGKFWFISATLWGFLGFVIANVTITVGIVIGLEVIETTERIFPFFGWSVAGFVLGTIIGGMTGIALIGLGKSSEHDDNIDTWKTI